MGNEPGVRAWTEEQVEEERDELPFLHPEGAETVQIDQCSLHLA